jgi:predicted Fe-Mo cluster-binding NifX family protein
MKVAITSQGNSLESKIDQRFGHCKYFVIYDRQTGSIEIIPNPYNETEELAGVMSAKLLASKNVNRIISGEFGSKVKPIFDSMQIQMIMVKDFGKTIKSIIDMLNNAKT